jgi:hypothetical protein
MSGTTIAHAFDAGKVDLYGEMSADYSLNTGGSNTNGEYPASNEFKIGSTKLGARTTSGSFTFNARLDFDNWAKGGSKLYPNLRIIAATYMTPVGLEFSAGRMVTSLGYESVRVALNGNYSFSYAYNDILPGYAEGVRAGYKLGDINLSATVSNTASPNNYLGDDNAQKAIEVAAAGPAGKWFSWYVGAVNSVDNTNAYGGIAGLQNRVTVADAYLTYAPMASASITFNFDLVNRTTSQTNNAKLSSTKLYGKVKLSQDQMVALRYEYVHNADRIVPLDAAGIQAITATDRLALTENLAVFGELRHDMGSAKAFVSSDGSPSNGASLATIGCIASF